MEKGQHYYSPLMHFYLFCFFFAVVKSNVKITSISTKIANEKIPTTISALHRNSFHLCIYFGVNFSLQQCLDFVIENNKSKIIEGKQPMETMKPNPETKQHIWEIPVFLCKGTLICKNLE